jgi:hypothetical protein
MGSHKAATASRAAFKASRCASASGISGDRGSAQPGRPVRSAVAAFKAATCDRRGTNARNSVIRARAASTSASRPDSRQPV